MYSTHSANAWPAWSSTEALAFSGVAVPCTPDADWAAAYSQERLFRNITLTQGQNNEDIVPVRARDGTQMFLSPSRATALVEGRGCVLGLGDDYVGGAAEPLLPSLAALGYSAGSVRPEIYVGTVFEGKPHGDERECAMAMPYQISDVPENLFLAPENEYEVMRKKDAARLKGVLERMALTRVRAFQSMSLQ